MNRTRKIAAAALAFTAAGSAGVAFAAWTSPQGTGGATAKSITAVKVDATATDLAAATGTLYPGSPAVNAQTTIKNDNPYPVTVSFVQGSGGITSNQAGCTAANNGVSYSPASGVALAANQTLAVVAGTVTMNGTSDTSCQNAIFTVPVLVNSVSAVTP